MYKLIFSVSMLYWYFLFLESIIKGSCLGIFLVSKYVCLSVCIRMWKNCSDTGTSKDLASHILFNLFFLRWHPVHTKTVFFSFLIHHFILIKSDLTNPYMTPHHSYSQPPDTSCKQMKALFRCSNCSIFVIYMIIL